MARAYSYSSIKTYKNCPKKFLHLQVKKDVKDKPFDASDYGSRAHKRVEEYILKVPDEKLSKPTVPLADVAFCTAVVDKMAAKAAMVASNMAPAITPAWGKRIIPGIDARAIRISNNSSWKAMLAVTAP